VGKGEISLLNLNDYFMNQRELEKAQKEFDIAQREYTNMNAA
jgi:hypothetical protein